MHYLHNLETDKLELHTGGKAEWMKLPEADRKEISRFCVFSKSRECWQSKGKAANAYWLQTAFKRLGFEDRGKVGEKLSLMERIEVQQEKAEARAARHEDLARRAEAESTAASNQSHKMMDAIPFGQPILIGHHSEGRDRRYRDRAWNLLGKAVHLSEKAAYHAARTETAQRTAEGAHLKNARYLQRRIKEREANLRRQQRYLAGKTYVYSTPRPVSDEERLIYEERIAVIEGELAFFQSCLEEIEKESNA